jgi:hypothetical protein
MQCTACALFAKPYLIKFSHGGTHRGRTEGDSWLSNCELPSSAALRSSPVDELPAHAAGSDMSCGNSTQSFDSSNRSYHCFHPDVRIDGL